MRIAESRATALTVRHPRITPETEAAASAPARAIASLASPPAHLAQYGTPDAGFIMQLIATATLSAANDRPDRPARNAIGAAYGYVHRAAQPLPPGNRFVRSI